MGMLLNGQWTNDDRVIVNGAYERNRSRFAGAADPEIRRAMKDNPGRFWLIASSSCPWSHRAMMVRSLRQLHDAIPMHMAHGERIQGYALDGGKPWTLPRTSGEIVHLHQLYAHHDAGYSGRATVPVLWDAARQKIVSNESADIVQAFDAIPSGAAPDFTLRPENLAKEIDTANNWIYENLNNAVYRAGFAGKQSAYEDAVETVFTALGIMEERLSVARYYFGNLLTETDIRIFATLVRFDCIYYILFKCCRRRLTDYPNLWNYARDLFQWHGIADTVDFDAMRRASYSADATGETRLVAVFPDADWSGDHQRDERGMACVALRNGGRRQVIPSMLKPIGDEAVS